MDEPLEPPTRARTRRARLGWALVALAVSLGALGGVSLYTFRYAEGLSYLRTDPRACVNCHIMKPQYDSWQGGSHHAAAVCVDCHLPASGVDKYLTKAENGWRHGKMFSLQTFAEPIRVTPRGREILDENCVRCHAEIGATVTGGAPHPAMAGTEELSCLHCHAGAGHGARTGLGGPLREAERSQRGSDK